MTFLVIVILGSVGCAWLASCYFDWHDARDQKRRLK